MTSYAPRVMLFDLEAADPAFGAVPRPWRPAQGDLAAAAPWAGGGLGTLVLLELTRAGDRRAALAVSVGEAVRRGLATAARATVAGRAPLTGRLSEGQVGGDLARRLATALDALVLVGRYDPGHGVVHLGPDGAASVESMPELAGCDPVRTHRLLVERYGPAATLRVGPAGERGAALASLASGGDEPSFVGRGGLGAAFAGLGLKALVVSAAEGPAEDDRGLSALLRRSPRLVARAEGGTFELGPLWEARGQLDPGQGTALQRGAQSAPRQRSGCRGCPTPCGWVFDRPGAGQPARFGKLWSLGPPLGLDFDGALALAAACDRVGVEAKEVGAALVRMAEARGALGDRERLEAWIEDLGRGSGPGWALARGAAGLGPGVSGAEARGPEGGATALLGAAVSSNGADPMRTFPFLLESGGRERLEQLLDGVPLPPGAEDPDSTVAKGRLVWWHENLVAALDSTGFCAFSAAGLLADGLLDLDELAESLLAAPLATRSRGRAAGRALLDAGATLVTLRRELADRWGPAAPAEGSARDRLGEPGMQPEYDRWRRLGWAAAEVESGAAPSHAPERPAGGSAGEVHLRSATPLGGLESGLSVHLDGPRRLEDLLRRVQEERGVALYARHAPLPSVYRGGVRLAAADWVVPGDELELVLAIAGG